MPARLVRSARPWRTTLGRVVVADPSGGTVTVTGALAHVWLALGQPFDETELISASEARGIHRADIEHAIRLLLDAGLVETR